MKKAVYETPVLRKHGSVEMITAALTCPGIADGTFSGEITAGQQTDGTLTIVANCS